MRLVPFAFKLHRLLSYLVFAQMLLWVIGGAVFALLPFQSWVKAHDFARKPTVSLAADWSQTLQAGLAQRDTALAEIVSVASFVSPYGPAWRAKHAKGETLLNAAGEPLNAPDTAAITAMAATIYTGSGRLLAVEHLQVVPRRLVIVKETGPRHNVWRASYDDSQSTRLYFDGVSGEFLTARTEAWVWFDLMWRLHVMDYADGEDFNNLLLRVFSVLALFFAASGAVLTVAAIRRSVRRLRRPASA